MSKIPQSHHHLVLPIEDESTIVRVESKVPASVLPTTSTTKIPTPIIKLDRNVAPSVIMCQLLFGSSFSHPDWVRRKLRTSNFTVLQPFSIGSIHSHEDHPRLLLPYPTHLVRPCGPTPSHSLYLSNLNDQPILHFSIKYLYVYRTSIPADALASSLAKALVEYYPLAGRLIPAGEKLEINCNAQGAVLAEAHAQLTVDDFLRDAGQPHQSWRKLLYQPPAGAFLDIPPLVIQVTTQKQSSPLFQENESTSFWFP
ncbi:hypothetical protein ZIOFF_028640 [Zingiber officinale]|uniref:Uncharacterized protein n=1 Tax=Zingiber officinale TaxID=94328 RepID=A0A8J5H6T5_ZINOF|nr:hypothetical protein ZIOFF_028640 [Zingiber officinale]